jgi:pyruvate,water dikinase
MQLFNQLLKRKLNKFRIPHEELDFSGDFPLLREYDPQYRIRQLHECWSELPESIRNDEIHYARLESMDGSHALEQFEELFKDLLEKFGYFSESGNDFSYPHWSEDPDFVLDLVRRGGGKMEIGPELKNDSRHKKRIGRSYRRAGRFRLYREMISAQYTKEYGLFRKLFLKTGEYLASTGMIEATEDVFYLTLEEHDALLGTKKDTGDDKKIPEDIGRVLQRIEERKKEMQEYENISLPSVIYGEVPPPLALKNETVIHGIPTSPGLFEGRIAVVKGYKDFGKNVDGVVLVIPFADVGWTPILTRAGAIVSESGGMLSHAAIVARELSIPSVSSVDHACSLEDGRMARVDGFNGVVILTEKQ